MELVGDDLDDILDRKLRVERLLGKLTERERDVIYDRFWQGMTCAEVGLKQGVTGGRIGQLEAKAVRKMKYAGYKAGMEVPRELPTYAPPPLPPQPRVRDYLWQPVTVSINRLAPLSRTFAAPYRPAARPAKPYYSPAMIPEYEAVDDGRTVSLKLVGYREYKPKLAWRA